MCGQHLVEHRELDPLVVIFVAISLVLTLAGVGGIGQEPQPCVRLEARRAEGHQPPPWEVARRDPVGWRNIETEGERHDSVVSVEGVQQSRLAPPAGGRGHVARPLRDEVRGRSQPAHEVTCSGKSGALRLLCVPRSSTTSTAHSPGGTAYPSDHL